MPFQRRLYCFLCWHLKEASSVTDSGVICLVPTDPGKGFCSDHFHQRVRPGHVHYHHGCGVYCEGAKWKIQSQAARSHSHRGDCGKFCYRPFNWHLQCLLEIRRIKLSFSFYSQTVIACGVSYGFNFNKIYSVSIVGKMVRGYVSIWYFFCKWCQMLLHCTCSGFIYLP